MQKNSFTTNQKHNLSYLPLWAPIHMVGKTLLIFSASSSWRLLPVVAELIPSLTSSEGSFMIRLSGVFLPGSGVALPEVAGEPLALNTVGFNVSPVDKR